MNIEEITARAKAATHRHRFEQKYERSIPSCTVKVWECPCGVWSVRHYGCSNTNHDQNSLATIDGLLAELREAREKLKAVEAMVEKLPPLDWKPRDEWGDYAAYPCADGRYSSVDETNQGDVHCHGIAVGEQVVRQELDHILKGSK